MNKKILGNVLGVGVLCAIILIVLMVIFFSYSDKNEYCVANFLDYPLGIIQIVINEPLRIQIFGERYKKEVQLQNEIKILTNAGNTRTVKCNYVLFMPKKDDGRIELHNRYGSQAGVLTFVNNIISIELRKMSVKYDVIDSLCIEDTKRNISQILKLHYIDIEFKKIVVGGYR